MTKAVRPRDDLRVDVHTGARTYVVASRQARPNLPDAGCPFCPGGLEAPEPYETRWFPNRWPAMPGGRCEVVLYTPEHDATFWSLGEAGARRVVDLWAERTAALGARPEIAYVLVFENRGAEVGATIAHPHGQIYAFDFLPDLPLRELQLGNRFDDPGERLVATEDGWRAWVPEAAIFPYALTLAPEEHVPDLPSLDDAGRAGLSRLLVDVLERLDRLFDEGSDEDDARRLSAMGACDARTQGGPIAGAIGPTEDAAARVPSALGRHSLHPRPSPQTPYMLWIHQRPFDGGDWPQARLHVEIVTPWRAPDVPRFVAAGELGSGVYFNPVAPEAAAQSLREALP